MYYNYTLNKIIYAIEITEHIFHSKWEHETALKTFYLLIDTFKLDEFMEKHNITEAEYEKYFEDFTKTGNEEAHKEIMQEFKEMEGKNATK